MKPNEHIKAMVSHRELRRLTLRVGRRYRKGYAVAQVNFRCHTKSIASNQIKDKRYVQKNENVVANMSRRVTIDRKPSRESPLNSAYAGKPSLSLVVTKYRHIKKVKESHEMTRIHRTKRQSRIIVRHPCRAPIETVENR